MTTRHDRLSVIASAIIGHPVSVVCTDLDDVSGWTRRTPRVIYLTPATTRPLSAWLRHHRVSFPTVCCALQLFVHEVGHLATDSDNERAAQEWMLKHLMLVAQRHFGMGRVRARRAWRWAWRIMPGLPAAYQVPRP